MLTHILMQDLINEHLHYDRPSKLVCSIANDMKELTNMKASTMATLITCGLGDNTSELITFMEKCLSFQQIVTHQPNTQYPRQIDLRVQFTNQPNLTFFAYQVNRLNAMFLLFSTFLLTINSPLSHVSYFITDCPAITLNRRTYHTQFFLKCIFLLLLVMILKGYDV